MRPLSIASLLAAPIVMIACSSGGPGSPVPGGAPGGFGSPGGSLPTFAPGSGGSKPGGGGTNPDPETDTGTGGGDQDTGTGGGTDTGGGGGGSCPAKCEGESASPFQSTCDARASLTRCTAEYDAYLSCLNTNRACTTSGTTDTAAMTTACESQQTTVQTCLSGGA